MTTAEAAATSGRGMNRRSSGDVDTAAAAGGLELSSPTTKPSQSLRTSLNGAAQGGDADTSSEAPSTSSGLKPLELEPLVGTGEEDDIVILGDDEGFSDDDSKHALHHHHGVSLGHKSSTAQVTVNIIISFVGAGLLGIPNAFSKSGWLLGTVALLATSAMNVYAMLRIPAVRIRIMQQQTAVVIHAYGDLGRVLMGSAGEVVVNIALAVSQVGFATAYIIFIAANLLQMTGISRGLTCLLCIPGLCLLVQAKDMKTLAPFSLLANASNLVGLSSVLFVDLETYEHDIGHEPVIHAVKWSGLLYVMAITLYSMEGVGLVLSLEQSCAEPAKFGGMLQRTVGAITVFMAVFGTFGYTAFGDNTHAPITLNLSSPDDDGDSGRNTAAHIVQSALCIALYLTYPVMMFPVWRIAADTLNVPQQSRQGVVLRVAIVCATTLVAYAVPDFGEFLSLVGSSLCTLLGFVLPCYFHHLVFGAERPVWQRRLDWFLMIGGALFGIVGTYQSAVNLLTSDEVEIPTAAAGDDGGGVTADGGASP